MTTIRNGARAFGLGILPAVLAFQVFTACKSDGDARGGAAGDDTSGGFAGDSSEVAGTAGLKGNHAAGRAGSSDVDDDGGASNEGGADNAGSRDDSAGGAPADAGTSSGGGSVGGGSVGGALGTVPDADGLPQLPDAPGPSTDQKATVISAKHTLPALLDLGVNNAKFDSEGSLVIALRPAIDGGGYDYGSLAKLDPTLTTLEWYLASTCAAQDATICQPTTALDGGTTRGLTIGDDDSIFVGGRAMNSKVSKLGPSGALTWTKEWTNAGNANWTDYVVKGPGGSVYGYGAGLGQAPGNTPVNVGGNVLVRYEADGTRAFITQLPKYQGNDSVFGNLLVADSGVSYVGIFDHGDFQTKRNLAFAKVSAAGKLVSTVRLPYLNAFEDVAFAPDQKSIYLEQYNAGHQLFNLALDGTVNWYFNLPPRTAIVEPTEGVTWSGQINSLDAFVVTSDSIYLAGKVSNIYKNGAVPRPVTIPGFVARFDLTGKQLWFKEFQFEGDTMTPVVDPKFQATLAVGSDGNPRVFFSAPYFNPADATHSAKVTRQVFLFTLAKKTGLLLE